MKQYRIYIVSFCLSAIAIVVFMVQYVNAFWHLLQDNSVLSGQPNPFIFFEYFLSPVFIISLLALGLFSLLYRILGILMVAKNKNINGGEQVLWIIGFVFMGFITGIIFIALAKSKQMITELHSKNYPDAGY